MEGRLFNGGRSEMEGEGRGDGEVLEAAEPSRTRSEYMSQCVTEGNRVEGDILKQNNELW